MVGDEGRRRALGEPGRRAGQGVVELVGTQGGQVGLQDRQGVLAGAGAPQVIRTTAQRRVEAAAGVAHGLPGPARPQLLGGLGGDDDQPPGALRGAGGAQGVAGQGEGQGAVGLLTGRVVARQVGDGRGESRLRAAQLLDRHHEVDQHVHGSSLPLGDHRGQVIGPGGPRWTALPGRERLPATGRVVRTRTSADAEVGEPVARAREKGGPWVALAAAVFYPMTLLLAKRRMEGLEKVPERGPAMLVCNHISYLDPVYTAVFVHRAKRVPRFLAKASLWDVPVLGRTLSGSRQIPVSRGSVEAGRASTRPARRSRTTASSSSTRRARSPATRRAGR